MAPSMTQKIALAHLLVGNGGILICSPAAAMDEENAALEEQGVSPKWPPKGDRERKALSSCVSSWKSAKNRHSYLSFLNRHGLTDPSIVAEEEERASLRTSAQERPAPPLAPRTSSRRASTCPGLVARSESGTPSVLDQLIERASASPSFDPRGLAQMEMLRAQDQVLLQRDAREQVQDRENTQRLANFSNNLTSIATTAADHMAEAHQNAAIAPAADIADQRLVILDKFAPLYIQMQASAPNGFTMGVPAAATGTTAPPPSKFRAPPADAGTASAPGGNWGSCVNAPNSAAPSVGSNTFTFGAPRADASEPVTAPDSVTAPSIGANGISVFGVPPATTPVTFGAPPATAPGGSGGSCVGAPNAAAPSMGSNAVTLGAPPAAASHPGLNGGSPVDGPDSLAASSVGSNFATLKGGMHRKVGK